MVLIVCAALSAASCSGGVPAGFESASSPAAAQPSPEAGAQSPGAHGPSIPRGISADGIKYLISVTQQKAEAANDADLTAAIDEIVDALGGPAELERNLDMHETAVIGQMPFQVWKVVDCSTGAGLMQIPPAPGAPNVLSLYLESLPDRTAFATYGVKEMPIAWRLFNLHLEGRGERFYVAVTDRNRQAWRWLGPFEMGSGAGTDMTMSSLDIQLPAVQNSSADGFAYFTIVPASGTELYVKGVSAGMGDTTLVVDPGFDDGDVLADF